MFVFFLNFFLIQKCKYFFWELQIITSSMINTVKKININHCIMSNKIKNMFFCFSHLGSNHTVRLRLGPPIHFIHMSGPLHTYKSCLTYFTCRIWSYICHTTLYGHPPDWAVCHIQKLTITTLRGCDWYLLPTSYNWQVHFSR